MSEQNQQPQQEIDNSMFKFKLNLDVINMMLSKLGKLPYEESAGIISLIMRQVQPQIEKLQAERAAAAAAEQQPEQPAA